jgi:L-ascorbate metabolism protein UlaG (beta-lactamase superfamily)
MFKRTVQKVAIALLSLLLIAGFVRSGLLFPAKASDVSTSAIDRYSRYYLNSNNDEPTNGSVKVTFYGTTMFLLDDGQTKLLFDAFITRPSAEITARSLQGEPLIQTNQAILDAWLARPEVGKPVAVFAAHSHHDHAMDIAYVAQKTGTQVYGSESTLNIARGGDIPEAQLSRYQLGKEIMFGDFTVTVLPGRHALNPNPFPDDRGILILEPLRQPAKLLDYTEGGAFDFLIKHGNHRILLKGHTYIPEVLDRIQADVLFLSVSPLAAGDLQSPDVFYDETVGRVKPKLVIPTHWDQFFLPLSEHLVPLNDEDLTTSFDFLIRRLTTDRSQFGIMQGYQSIMLFGNDGYGV